MRGCVSVLCFTPQNTWGLIKITEKSEKGYKYPQPAYIIESFQVKVYKIEEKKNTHKNCNNVYYYSHNHLFSSLVPSECRHPVILRSICRDFEQPNTVQLYYNKALKIDH